MNIQYKRARNHAPGSFYALKYKIVHTSEYFVHIIWSNNINQLPLHSFLKVVQKKSLKHIIF